MTLWEELADIKRRIPKDFMPWRVEPRFCNITMTGRTYISQKYYDSNDLGRLDEPMSDYRKYGVYSTKEKAIAAAQAYEPSYELHISEG